MSKTNHTSGHTNGQSSGGTDAAFPEDSEEISLIDILLVVVRNRRLIMWTVAIFGAVGLMMAILSPREYTSSAKLIRELQAESGGQGFGNLSFLRGFGVDIGTGAAGLTPDAYPDIVKSREVRLSVVQDTFYFPELGKRTTFVEYANKPPGFGELVLDYTIGLPWTIKEALQGNKTTGSLSQGGLAQYPTEDEETALNEISKKLGSGLDVDTGLMTISVSTRHPQLSAALTQSFVDHLVERVREIRTQKARRDLEFITRQFEEARLALREAENELSIFEDRNNNIQRARLLTEQSRLQRQVTFKSDLYSSLQAQLSQAQINLQRSEPVITLLERPVPPIEPSGSSRVSMIIWFAIMGGMVGAGLSFARVFVEQRSAKEEERAKIEELRDTLQPRKVVASLLRRKQPAE